MTSLVRLPLTGREFRFSFLNQSQINTPKTPYFPHFPHQLVAMAHEQQLCDSCELEYFYVIGKYHGAIFPGHDKFALEFFREHHVLPLSVECPKCKKNLVYREDRHQWYCNASVPPTRRSPVTPKTSGAGRGGRCTRGGIITFNL